MEYDKALDLEPVVDDEQELTLDALDLGGIELLEEDIVPCTCCGNSCSC